MTTPKPVYIMFAGICHHPKFLTRLIDSMSAQGHTLSTVAYPTVLDPPASVLQTPANLTLEIDAFRHAILTQLDTEHRDVVVVLHSYGGVAGSRAIVGLTKAEREAQGKTTGVVEIIFVSAFLLPENYVYKAGQRRNLWLTDERTEMGIVRTPNEKAQALLFSDMDEEEQRYWASELRPHVQDGAEDVVVPGAPWHLAVPKRYVVLMEDKVLTPGFQLGSLATVADETWVVKSMPGGHEPFLSRPDHLARVLTEPR